MGKAKALLFDLSSSVSYGRMSAPAKILFPLLVIKADDQGRGLAEPDVLKWKVCPNVTEIGVDDIERLLHELADPQVDVLLLYEDCRQRKLYQLLRWWQPEIGSGSCLLWARPSEYDAPEGWTDRVRLQRGPGRSPLLISWSHPGGFAQVEETPKETQNPPSELPNQLPNQLPSGQNNLNKSNIREEKNNAAQCADPGLEEGGEEGGSSSQTDPPSATERPHTIPPKTSRKDAGGASAPSSPPPSRPRGLRYTEGQQKYLALFGGKRFRTTAAAEAVLEFEQAVGTTKLLEYARKAAEKQLSVGDSIAYVRGCIKNASETGARKEANDGRADAATAAAVRAHVRRSRRGTDVEATSPPGG